MLSHQLSLNVLLTSAEYLLLVSYNCSVCFPRTSPCFFSLYSTQSNIRVKQSYVQKHVQRCSPGLILLPSKSMSLCLCLFALDNGFLLVCFFRSLGIGRVYSVSPQIYTGV